MEPLEVAMRAAREAGAFAFERQKETLEISEKSSRQDLVTDADRRSEALIVRILRDAFPRAGILGEEGTSIPGSDDERWIIDPIDGTLNYANRLEYFAVSIGLERGGTLVCGVVYAPALKKMYAAERGSGAYCNEERLRVSSSRSLSQVLVGTGEHEPDRFAALAKHALGVRYFGAAALDLAWVAAGSLGGVCHDALKPWDVAAGKILVEEAGGLVSAINGETFSLENGSTLASNGEIHQELLAVVRAAA
jgi:myo-inositol-1(or 4)-monophosphatase